MVKGHNRGIGNGATQSSNNPHSRNANKFNLQERWTRYLLLASSIPFAVLSAKPAQASASLLSKLNPIPPETQESFTKISNGIDKVIEWFKYFRENVAQLSIDFMTWAYEMISNVVLHTPLFLFDSSWFRDNIATFTGLSLALSIVLSMSEGFQRMLGHLFKSKVSKAPSNRTDLKRISKRIPLAIAGSALAPLFFLYLFKGINGLTDIIVNIGRSQMGGEIDKINFTNVSWTELVVFLGFDIALLFFMIPIFLQNFRRWFDLLCMGVLTPLALSCWVFKAHEHHFHNWAESIKKNSLTQLTYAVFLLLIGTLMLSTKAPETNMEAMIKLGVCVGGLWRMSNPPAIMRRYVDTGTDLGGMWKGAGEALIPNPIIKQVVKRFRGLKAKKLVTGGSAA